MLDSTMIGFRSVPSPEMLSLAPTKSRCFWPSLEHTSLTLCQALSMPMRMHIPSWNAWGNDHLPLTCSRKWGNVDLTNMADPRHLDLTVNQVQDNICLTSILDPCHLAVCQVRGNVRLINMLNIRHLNLTLINMLNTRHLDLTFLREWPSTLDTPKGMTNLSWT